MLDAIFTTKHQLYIWVKVTGGSFDGLKTIKGSICLTPKVPISTTLCHLEDKQS